MPVDLFRQGKPEEYARCIGLAGKAIHEENQVKKVIGLDSALCAFLWAEKIPELMPYDCFDVARVTFREQAEQLR